MAKTRIEDIIKDNPRASVVIMTFDTQSRFKKKKWRRRQKITGSSGAIYPPEIKYHFVAFNENYFKNITQLAKICKKRRSEIIHFFISEGIKKYQEDIKKRSFELT